MLVGLGMIGLRRQFVLTAELAQAREEVAQLAASEERLRLARDLHDLTGQSLSMITLKSELAAKLLRRLPDGRDRDRALARGEEVAAVSRQTLHDIREAISGYRRPTLAVEIITARTALESAGITTHDDAELTLLSGTFDPDVEAALAWCLREAATNVIRHSGARNCHVSLARRAGGLCLEVRDDGPGRRRRRRGGPAPATGLRGMSERLSALGGHLELRPRARLPPAASVPEDIADRLRLSAARRARRAAADAAATAGDAAGRPSAGALPWRSDHHPGAAGRGPGDDPRGARRAALVRGRHRGGRPGRPGRRGDWRRPSAPAPTSPCSTSRCRAWTGSPPPPSCGGRARRRR